MSRTGLLPVAPYTLYRIFKYSVYSFLTINIFLFFREDQAAAAEMFSGGVDWRNVIAAYSATIDTIAWVTLLLLFELETAVIPDRYLRGSLKWILLAVRSLCYGFIVSALYGYINKYGDITAFVPWAGPPPCDLPPGDYTFVADLDEYPPINAATCVALQGEGLVQIEGTRILATATALTDAIRLALVDIVNAATWLLVVAALELEVYLQLRGQLTDRLLRANTAFKSLLYLTLLVCAAYWGVKGDFIPDFWDAFWWLAAFVFIELNMFEWQQETREGGLADQSGC